MVDMAHIELEERNRPRDFVDTVPGRLCKLVLVLHKLVHHTVMRIGSGSCFRYFCLLLFLQHL